MKTIFLSPRTLFLIFGILLAILSVAFFSPLQLNLSGAAGSSQTTVDAPPTPTPEVIDELEVGSTDGILILAILIALAILIPILASGSLWKKAQ
jgi:hypothetical protein